MFVFCDITLRQALRKAIEGRHATAALKTKRVADQQNSQETPKKGAEFECQAREGQRLQ